MNNLTEIQMALSKSSDIDKGTLFLWGYENMSDAQIISHLATYKNHLMIMDGVIEGGFKFTDAPTPKPHIQAIMIKDFNEKSQAMANILGKSKSLENAVIEAVMHTRLNDETESDMQL